MPDKNMTIMSVDDFSTMRRIIKTLLKQLGYTNVIEADDGTTAWDMLQNHEVDFIISDWNMPKMTGLDLLKKVRQDDRFNGMPFLMVTAEAEKDNIVQAVKAGVSNYIVKPFTADVLKQKIEKIFGSA
jgi:two-component system chemotaxis response regulator CheY